MRDNDQIAYDHENDLQMMYEKELIQYISQDEIVRKRPDYVRIGPKEIMGMIKEGDKET